MLDKNSQALGLNLADCRVLEPAADILADDVRAADVFGLPSLGDYVVPRFHRHGLPVPRLNPHYVFRAETLKPILAWLEHSGGDAYMLSGPAGCSKTSTFLQVFARLNQPAMVCSLNESFDFLTDLVGTVEARDGTTYFRYGPLPLCMHLGMRLVLNEADAAKPGVLTAAYDVLEGGDLLIPQTNEIVRPHPDFRIAICANTNGAGDETGRYRGRKIQCGAFMDRFRGDLVDYPSPSSEFEILNRRFPTLGAPLITRMVAYAGETRLSAKDETTGLSDPVSIRTLCRAAEVMTGFGVAVSDDADLPNFSAEISRAFELAYWFRLTRVDRKTATTVFQTCFGIAV